MHSWKEYPRAIGGLAKYLSWFKDFERPHDLHSITKDTKKPHRKVSLFGSEFDHFGKINLAGLEQGSIGDNYLLTMLAAMADKGLAT